MSESAGGDMEDEEEQNWEGGTQIDSDEQREDQIELLDAGDETESDRDWADPDGSQLHFAVNDPEGTHTAQDVPTGAQALTEPDTGVTQPTDVDNHSCSPLTGDGGAPDEGDLIMVSCNTESLNDSRTSFPLSSTRTVNRSTDRDAYQAVTSRSPGSMIPCDNQISFPSVDFRTDDGAMASGKRVPSSPLRRTGQGSRTILASMNEPPVQAWTPRRRNKSDTVVSTSASIATSITTVASLDPSPRLRITSPSLAAEAVMSLPTADGESTLAEHDVLLVGASERAGRLASEEISSSPGVPVYYTSPPVVARKATSSPQAFSSPGFLSSEEASLKDLGAQGRSGASGVQSTPSSNMIYSGWLECQLATHTTKSSSIQSESGEFNEKQELSSLQKKCGAAIARDVSTVSASNLTGGHASKGCAESAGVPVPGPSAPPSRCAKEEKSYSVTEPLPDAEGWIQRRGTSSGRAVVSEGAGDSSQVPAGIDEDVSTREVSNSLNVLGTGLPPESRASLSPKQSHHRESHCCIDEDHGCGPDSEEVKDADDCTPAAATGLLPDTQDMLDKDMSQERRRQSQKTRETDGAIDRALREAQAIRGDGRDYDKDDDILQPGCTDVRTSQHSPQQGQCETGSELRVVHSAERNSHSHGAVSRTKGDLLPDILNESKNNAPGSFADSAGDCACSDVGAVGGSMHGKRKLMKANTLDCDRPTSGGSARRGVALNTPGAYMGTSGSITSSAKKKMLQCTSRSEDAPNGTKSGFEISSDDDDDDRSNDVEREGATLASRGNLGDNRFSQEQEKRAASKVKRGKQASITTAARKSSILTLVSPSRPDEVSSVSVKSTVHKKGLMPSCRRTRLALSKRSHDTDELMSTRPACSAAGTCPRNANKSTDAAHCGMEAEDGDGDECTDTSPEARKTDAEKQTERAMVLIREDQFAHCSKRTDAARSCQQKSEELGELEMGNSIPSVPVGVSTPTAVPNKPKNRSGRGSMAAAIGTVSRTKGAAQPEGGSDSETARTRQDKRGASSIFLGDDEPATNARTMAAPPGVGTEDFAISASHDIEAGNAKQAVAESAYGDKASENDQEWPIEFKYLWPFLTSKGWSIKKGRGLDTWLYVKPQRPGGHPDSGKQRKRLVRYQDYFVNEKDVVAFAMQPENTDILEAFKIFGRKHLANTVYSGSRRTTKGQTVFEGEGTGSQPSNAGSKPSAGSNKKNRSKSSVSCSDATVVGNGHDLNASKPNSDKARVKATTGFPIDAPVEYAREHGHDVSHTGSAAPSKPCVNMPELLGNPQPLVQIAEARTDSGQEADDNQNRSWQVMWEEAKRRMAEEGWRTVGGTGIVTWVYLKKGVTKATGRLGVDMFHSEVAVVEHLFGSKAHQLSQVDSTNLWEEWNLSKHRSKRRRVERMVAGNLSSSAVVSATEGLSNEEVGQPVAPASTRSGKTSKGNVRRRRAGSSSAAQSALPRQDTVKATGDQVPQSSSPQSPNVEPDVKAPGSRIGSVGVSAQAKPIRGGGGGNNPRHLSRAYREGENHPSLNQPSLDTQDAKGGKKNGMKVKPQDYPDVDGVDDDSEGATQPQNELASALNMAAVGRLLGDTETHETAEEMKTEAKATCTVTENDQNEAMDDDDDDEDIRLDELVAMSAPNLRRDAPKTPSGLQVTSSRPVSKSRPPSEAAVQNSRSTRGSPTGAAASAWINAMSPPASIDSACVKSTPTPSITSRPGRGSSVGTHTTRLPSSPPTALRTSTRRTGNNILQGFGVIVTGCREGGRSKRDEVENSIKALGGTVIAFPSGVRNSGNAGSAGGSDHWSRWFATGENQDIRGSAEGESRSLLAVASPESYRTPKYVAAVAAGVEIVHPLYLTACQKAKTKLDTTGYLLPLGRSALADRDVVMPRRAIYPHATNCGSYNNCRRGPFWGKRVLLFVGGSTSSSPASTWGRIMIAAGAEVTKAGADGRVTVANGTGVSMAGRDRDCDTINNFENMLNGLRHGRFDFLIAPEMDMADMRASGNVDGDGEHSRRARIQVVVTAQQGGVLAGTLEWAAQCIINGRVLSPDTAVCPWFPLDVRKRVSSDDNCVTSERKEIGGGRRGNGKSKAKVKSTQIECGVVAVDRFYVHCTRDGKRYVAGDYMLMLGRGNGVAIGSSEGACRKEDGLPRDSPSRKIARVLSFERGKEGDVEALILIMDVDGRVVWVNPKDAKGEESKEATRVRLNQLGSRILVIGEDEVNQTTGYSIDDPSVYFIKYRR